MINVSWHYLSPLHLSLTQQENTHPLDAARFILRKDKKIHMTWWYIVGTENDNCNLIVKQTPVNEQQQKL